MEGYTPTKNQWFSLSDGITGLETIIFLLIGILQFNYIHVFIFYEHVLLCELRLEARAQCR